MVLRRWIGSVSIYPTDYRLCDTALISPFSCRVWNPQAPGAVQPPAYISYHQARLAFISQAQPCQGML